jgi:hypothetical protein
MYARVFMACFSAFILAVLSTHAVVFNEIMYDPLGADDNQEWLEIYNEQNQTVNLQNWKFFEDNINHGMALINGSYLLGAYGYAVIAQDAKTFLSNNSNFNGTLFDSSWQLLINSGELIALKNSTGQTQNNLAYSSSWGGSDNGYSVGIYNGIWKETFPTPGKENSVSNVCDFSVAVLSDKFIFENKSNFSWSIQVQRMLGEPSSVTIKRSIEDLGGSVVKAYDDLNHSINERETINYDPNMNPGAYLVKAEIVPGCNDTIMINNKDEKLVAVKEPPKDTESSIEINNVYDLGSDDEAQFGQLIRVRVHAYRGDTEKQEISLWIENDNEKVSKVLNFKILEKFNAQEMTLPVQIFSNCNEEYKEGSYDVVVKGFDKDDSEEIRIKGIAKDSCMPGVISSSSAKQKFGFQLLEVPAATYSGHSFSAKIRIYGDDEQHKLKLWSYVYRGSKSYSGERESNKKYIELLPGSTAEVILSNVVSEAEAGDYKFKVLLNKDDQKTNREIITNLTIAEFPISKSESEAKQSAVPQSAIYKRPYAVSRVVFESTQRKAEHLIPYFITTVMAAMTIFLIVSKPL